VENYPSAIMINGADDESRTTDGKAVVNMYGGTINGGSTVTTQVQKTADGGNGGAIRVGSLSGEGRLYKDPDGDGTKSYYYNTYAGVATFNMYGGTINGGHAEGNNGGGTVYVNGNTFNMYGGTINGGIAKAHDYPGNASEVGKGTNGGYGGAFFLMARTPKDVENNNMDVVPGVVNIEGGTINGYQEDDTTTSFGSVFVVNNDCVLNMSGGTVNGGYATGQGGILRAYLSDVNLSGDAKLYSGWAERNKTHGLWMVDSDLVMSGNAAVYAKNAGDLVVQVGGYKVGSTAIISGNATVKNASGTSSNHVGVPYSADYVNKLMIANDWNGEIYCNINNTSKGSYTPGANITEDNANHYVGALADGVVTKGGTYTGKLYYGSEAIGVLAEDGDLILAAAATVDANGVETWVGSNEAALDAYTAGNAKYVILNGAAEINGNVKIDLNGSNVELTGTGTVYGMDSSNDDYEGYKKLTVADGIIVAADVVNPVNGNRYISLKEGEGEWSFHRVELVLTHVTLRTTEAGLYYKAKYLCDDKLAGQVLGYGVVLSTANMPGNDFMTETKDINDWTMIDGPLAVNDEHVATATSGGLFGVLKDIETTTRTAGENVTAAQMNVYANLYLAIDRIGDGNPNNAEYIMGDTENQDDPAGTAWNLLGVLEAINKTENWSQYSETQKTNVKNAVLTWANWITEAAQIEWAGKLNNILQ